MPVALAVTGRSFGEKDFRSGLENGILLCELLTSIKPGLVKKINRLPTPIAGLDNLTVGSDCWRKLKNVLITIYWLGKAANSCATYNGPTLNLKAFEGLLSMIRKECVNEEAEDSRKRSIRDSGYIDSWESERSDSMSPPRHGRENSFDSLDSFGSRSRNTPSPDTVIRCISEDSEGDGVQRKLPDVRKDDMSARRVSYKEPRGAMPFNQYLPNKSNQTNYLPAPLRKRRSEREDDRRSVSNSTSPVGGERPLRQKSLEVVKEGAVMSQNTFQKSFWADEKEAKHEEMEINKLRKLEKAGIKVLPASVRYNSPIGSHAETIEDKPPSPDIILRCENDFMRADATHQWDSNEEDEDEAGERKVPDLQKDDLASRKARMNQFKPSAVHHFLPGSCSWKDQQKWEGIRLASQHAVLERMEKLEQEKLEKKSQVDAHPEVPFINLRDGSFMNPVKDSTKDLDDEDGRETDQGKATPSQGSSSIVGPDFHNSVRPGNMAETQDENREQLSVSFILIYSESDSTPAEVSIITRKDNPFFAPEKQSGTEKENEGGTEREEIERVVIPNVKTDDLARRWAQSGALPQKDQRQSLAQTTITQSDLEKWQRLKMTTDSSDDPTVPLCQMCLEKGCLSVSSKTKAAKNDLATCRESSSSERRRFVTFGGVTEMENISWNEDEEEEEGGRELRDEAVKLQSLISVAPVAVPTIGLGSRLTKRAMDR
ncbi:hypothetical protein DNTS_004614 [Danionella cerebrum]|uniref:DUF4757 domain-containing protein n=1 Tax=Danionella cerebrum TaxID=2873325 RepID=A0A553QWX8_9TELE|nr:hypothetical protein DNTS_004614 [Danionella translucida]